ncbi:MAG: hypothetical protein P8X95_17020, partial [Anaerolineales bacterium]
RNKGGKGDRQHDGYYEESFRFHFDSLQVFFWAKRILERADLLLKISETPRYPTKWIKMDIYNTRKVRRPQGHLENDS